MISVDVRDKNLERAIRALRKKVDRDGCLKEFKEKRRYTQKSRKKYIRDKRINYEDDGVYSRKRYSSFSSIRS
jgi:ribosomal protein S21